MASLELQSVNQGINYFIIHQTHYEKSDWSRVFNQFTIACELDVINTISAADISYRTNIYISKKKLEVPYVVSLMFSCNNYRNMSDLVKEINSSTNNCS